MINTSQPEYFNPSLLEMDAAVAAAADSNIITKHQLDLNIFANDSSFEDINLPLILPTADKEIQKVKVAAPGIKEEIVRIDSKEHATSIK